MCFLFAVVPKRFYGYLCHNRWLLYSIYTQNNNLWDSLMHFNAAVITIEATENWERSIFTWASDKPPRMLKQLASNGNTEHPRFTWTGTFLLILHCNSVYDLFYFYFFYHDLLCTLWSIFPPVSRLIELVFLPGVKLHWVFGCIIGQIWGHEKKDINQSQSRLKNHHRNYTSSKNILDIIIKLYIITVI